MSLYDEMTAEHHRIDWTIERESVTGTFTCTAPASELCRSEPTCACEEYGAIGREDDGRWYHTLLWQYIEEGCEGVDLRHHHAPTSPHCTYVESFEMGCADEYYGGDATPLRNGPIVITWDFDEYAWHYPDAPAASEAV